MEDIIAPIDKKVLKSELTEDKRLRFTNKSNNEIYIVTWKNAPNVLKEIGNGIVRRKDATAFRIIM